MKLLPFSPLVIVGWLSVAPAARAEITVITDRNANGAASAEFRFAKVGSPRRADAATGATFTLLDGRQDPNGAGLEALHDGRLPTEEDEPGANFFLAAGSSGGRILVDLGTNVAIAQVNSYSWHTDVRAPQVYDLFASDGSGAGFQARPARGSDPAGCGWQRLAHVDTRPASGSPGGQYAASVADAAGPLGTFRYLLFDVAPTSRNEAFGQTFLSEVDVVSVSPAPEPPAAQLAGGKETFTTPDKAYEFTLVTTDAPDLTDWARQQLMPQVLEFYPKLVGWLPSEGYTAPARVTLTFRGGMGGTPAATSGTRVGCNREWFRSNLKGEALGCVMHELVHVVQQYRRVPGAQRPGWLVEGIADYLRWYRFEPKSGGAEISRRNLDRARYDGSYRITANFLNWVSLRDHPALVTDLNAALRNGTYKPELWTQLAGGPVEELGQQWRASLEAKLGVPSATNQPPAKP